MVRVRRRTARRPRDVLMVHTQVTWHARGRAYARPRCVGSMNWRLMRPLAVWMLASCAVPERERRAAVDAPAVQLRDGPTTLQLRTRVEGDSVLGAVLNGDTAASAVRLVVRPTRDVDAMQRLCGVIASGVTRPVVVDWGLPVDTAQPPLSTRLIAGVSVQGIRFLLPGADAKYVFEGVSRRGARVSLQWPVRADRAVPAGAADSVIDAAITPSARTVDSLVQSLHIEGESVEVSTKEPMMPRTAAAVRLDGLLPRFDVVLASPCLDVTYAIPVVARIETRLRLSVPPRAMVQAVASVPDGAVRLAFEEAPAPTDPRTREAVPSASIRAGASGRVTLRLRLQVVPRSQPTGQVVLVRLRTTAAGEPDR